MRQVIVHNNEDGGLAVITPTPTYIKELLETVDDKGEFLYRSIGACITAIAEKDCPEGVPYRIMSEAAVRAEIAADDG